jgi:hypothetical protein
MTTPRGAIRRVLAEIPALRATLLSKRQMPSVAMLDDWKRLLEYAVGQRSTSETPIPESSESDPSKPK